MRADFFDGSVDFDGCYAGNGWDFPGKMLDSVSGNRAFGVGSTGLERC